MRQLKGVKFSEFNPVVVGIVGLVVVGTLMALSLNVSAVRDTFGKTRYEAYMRHAGGVRDGDPVRISGMDVGRVVDVELDRTRVRVKFSVDSGIRLGDQTQAGIRSANALGAKYLDLRPRGLGSIEVIPMSQTAPSYDVLDALSDLTATEQQLDVRQLAESFDALSETFDGTGPELRGALEGVQALSETIAARDAEIRELMQNARKVTGVLSDRTEDVIQILKRGNQILEELDDRRVAIDALLVHARSAAVELTGVVDDNQAEIGSTLRNLTEVVGILERNSDNITEILEKLGPFVRSLGEAVGGGPFFFAYLANVVPSDLAPIIPDLIRKDANGGGTP